MVFLIKRNLKRVRYPVYYVRQSVWTTYREKAREFITPDQAADEFRLIKAHLAEVGGDVSGLKIEGAIS